MKLNSISLEVSFRKGRKLTEISIFKLNHNVGIEEFLKHDRASYEVYPESHVDIPPQVVSDPNTPWGMPLGIDLASVDENNQIYVAPTLAIHLLNVELACKEKLLIYDNNFLIKEYLGPDYHAMGMRWLRKKWGEGRLSLYREKSISNELVHYDTGIDFSTEPGDTNVYHWIARTLPKIKFVKLLPKEIPLIFSYQPNKFQIECLQFLDVKNPILVIDPGKIAKFKSLVLIEGPWAVGNPPQQNWLIQESLGKINSATATEERQPRKRKKIFIYRDKSARRLMINQSDVRNLLAQRGFESFLIEDLSYKECVSLFNSADEVVFEHGASGIWILFTNPDAKILEILPERNHISSKELSNYYFWLSCFLKRKFRYLVCKNKRIDPWAEYEVNLKELTLQLDQLGMHAD